LPQQWLNKFARLLRILIDFEMCLHKRTNQPAPNCPLMIRAIALTLIVCTLFTAAQSWKVVMLHYRNHGVTAGTDIPLVFPHAALLFGFSFMALAALVRIRSYISGRFE